MFRIRLGERFAGNIRRDRGGSQSLHSGVQTLFEPQGDITSTEPSTVDGRQIELDNKKWLHATVGDGSQLVL